MEHYNISQVELQQLYNRVIKHNVKKLPENIVNYINQQSDQPTLIRKSIDVLQQYKILNWPIEYNRPDKIDKFTIQQIPRYIQLLICMNWQPEDPELLDKWGDMSTYQQLFHYFNNITHVPVCKVCKTNKTRWSKGKFNYTDHCSNKCRANDPDVETKRKNTCIDKYGHDKSLSNRQHLNITRNTLKQNHGVMFPFKNQQLLDAANKRNCPQRRTKAAVQALQTKYNQPNKNFGQILSTPEFINKRRQTAIENWLPERIEQFSTVAKPLFKTDQYNNRFQMLPFKCCECGEEFEDNLRDGTIPRCPVCYPLNSTNWVQQQLIDYCSTLDNNVLINTRKIISPKEIDIFFPAQRVAIEFNGLYWHSEVGSNGRCDRQYHINKTNQCRDQNIQLLHIFEDEWNNSPNVVKSLIENKINETQQVIFARKCVVKQIDAQTKSTFLYQNHLQGNDNSKIALGLFYQDNLVAAMTFGSPRFNKMYQWEMIRYCCKNFTRVAGGASKLLSYFEQKFSPKNLISYSDVRYSNGNLYKNLNFKLHNITAPGYYYVDIKAGCTNRLNRLQFQKHKLKDKLQDFDDKLSQHQNMINSGYSKIWNCGQMVFAKQY